MGPTGQDLKAENLIGQDRVRVILRHQNRVVLINRGQAVQLQVDPDRAQGPTDLDLDRLHQKVLAQEATVAAMHRTGLQVVNHINQGKIIEQVPILCL